HLRVPPLPRPGPALARLPAAGLARAQAPPVAQLHLARRIGPRHDADPLHGLPELAPVDRQLVRVPLRNELAVLRELPLDQPGDQAVPANLADRLGLPGPDGTLVTPEGPVAPSHPERRPPPHAQLRRG